MYLHVVVIQLSDMTLSKSILSSSPMAWTLTPRSDGLDVHRSEFRVDGHQCNETLVQWKGSESSLVTMVGEGGNKYSSPKEDRENMNKSNCSES